MPAENRGASRQGSDDLLYHRIGRRRKQTPARFASGDVPPPQPPRPHPSPEEHQHALQQQQIEENSEADVDPDESGTDPEEFDEVVALSLPELRSNVQCPICLGIIKKARTVMGCLHRFCRECIDKSMRLGNNECPACRIHCASRRSLRDDLSFDTFVRTVYADVEKYEQEPLNNMRQKRENGGLNDSIISALLQELVLYEDEKAVNEQIQASIAQSFLRQSEATRARKGRGTAAPTSRMDRTCNKSYSRRSYQSFNCSDPNKNRDESGTGMNELIYEDQLVFSQETMEQCAGISPIRIPSMVVDEENMEDIQNSMEHGMSSSSPINTDLLSWGGAGIRSQTRRSGSSKVIRRNRIKKLADHLANVEKNNRESVSPLTTTHPQSDELIWLKDYTKSCPNASVSIDVLMSPPHVVERFSNEFKSNSPTPQISGV